MSEQKRPYTVVVGVSATTKSSTALTWGKAQADANHGRLVAVRVHSDPRASQGTHISMADTDLRAAQQARLEQDVSSVLGEGHGTEVRVLHGSRRRALINVSHEADLLVIDAPRAPSMSPLLAQRIIYAARCPVVVMPPSVSGEPESSMSRSAAAVARAAVRSVGTSGRPGYRPPSGSDD
jgi:hypothetical protein